MKESLSKLAKELRDLSLDRKYSESLHDYLYVLVGDDEKIKTMIDYLKVNPNASEDEIYDAVDKISPPPEIIIEE